MSYCLVEFRDSLLAAASADNVETLSKKPHAVCEDSMVDWYTGPKNRGKVTKHAAKIVKIGGLSVNITTHAHYSVL